MIKMNELQQEQYSRQIKLDNIGIKGQEALLHSSVCVVGCGGLGNTILTQLVTMGVGKIKIIDGDNIELSNLHRQHLFTKKDIGISKVICAGTRLKHKNEDCIIETSNIWFNDSTHEEIKGYDVVIDALDSQLSRRSLNAACVKYKIPLVTGAAVKDRGQVFTVIPGESSCYNCVYGPSNAETLSMEACNTQGINPSVLSIIASMQVSETIDIIVGNKPQLLNKILFFILDGFNFIKTETFRNKECDVCRFPIYGV